MNMASPKYNRALNDRTFWLVQASENNDGGWNWSYLIDEKPHREPWGGSDWIRNSLSRKRIREELRTGDIAFCYQAAPDKQFLGLARIDMRGNKEENSFFLDWWCRMPSVPFEKIKNDPILKTSEKVAGVGQGTLFALSQDEGMRLLELSQPNQAMRLKIRDHLNITLEPVAASGELHRASEGQEMVEIAELIASAQAAAQGFQNDPEVRKAIEQYAVLKACQHYEKMGYHVIERGKPFDLECTRPPDRLYVEVKGTQTAGLAIFLTPNEVEWSQKHSMELFIVHSLIVSKSHDRVTVGGGVERVVSPWRPENDSLKVVAYSYLIEDINSHEV